MNALMASVSECPSKSLEKRIPRPQDGIVENWIVGSNVRGWVDRLYMS